MKIFPHSDDRVRSRIQIILLLGFGALVGLIGFTGYSALQRAGKSYTDIEKLHDADRLAERIVTEIRSNLQFAAISNRDYLLDPSADRQAAVGRTAELKTAIAAALDRLEPLVRSDDKINIQTMRQQLVEYWKLQNQLFELEPLGKEKEGYPILLESRNKRLAVMDLAAQTEALTAETYRKRREQIDQERAHIPFYVAQIVGVALGAGIVVAAMGAFQIFQLEGLARLRLNKVAAAEAELRGLSQKLVQAQEEERRSLSRELHDHVGQLLTAIRIGIGNLQEALPPVSESAQARLDQTKRLAEEALSSVRDLSMGLRPAMLDDLGLGAALEWQARQHSRVYGTPVSVKLSGDLDQLSDTWRTCTYRVVQEALNNVAKHAAATEAVVTVRAGEGRVSVIVRDNGRGFDFAAQKGGLGLVGIKERVRELGGEMRIDSTPGSGAAVHVVIGAEIPKSNHTPGVADGTRV